MELQNIQGEVFSSEARVQLSLLSYLKICLIMAVGWALLDVVIGLLTVRIPEGSQSDPQDVIAAVVAYVGFGFIKSLLCGVISYPIYRAWCQRYRGQRLTGKFAIIVAP